MPNGKLSRKAFDRKIDSIIKKATDLEASSVKAATDLLNDLRKQINDQIKLAEQWDVSFIPRLTDEVTLRINRFSEKLLKQVNEKQAEAFQVGQTMVDEPLETLGIDLDVSELSDELLLVSAAFMVDLIQNASTDAIDKISTQLNQSIIAGETQSQTLEKINGIFQIRNRRGLTARAERIVRTEVPRVFSIATQARMVQADEVVPDLMRKWRTLGDFRVRGVGEKRKTPRFISTGLVDHRVADGQVVGVNEPFIVSGENLMFPRDPGGSPENVIECRCYVVPELGRFEEE